MDHFMLNEKKSDDCYEMTEKDEQVEFQSDLFVVVILTKVRWV